MPTLDKCCGFTWITGVRVYAVCDCLIFVVACLFYEAVLDGFNNREKIQGYLSRSGKPELYSNDYSRNLTDEAALESHRLMLARIIDSCGLEVITDPQVIYNALATAVMFYATGSMGFLLLAFIMILLTFIKKRRIQFQIVMGGEGLFMFVMFIGLILFQQSPLCAINYNLGSFRRQHYVLLGTLIQLAYKVHEIYTIFRFMILEQSSSVKSNTLLEERDRLEMAEIQKNYEGITYKRPTIVFERKRKKSRGDLPPPPATPSMMSLKSETFFAHEFGKGTTEAFKPTRQKENETFEDYTDSMVANPSVASLAIKARRNTGVGIKRIGPTTTTAKKKTSFEDDDITIEIESFVGNKAMRKKSVKSVKKGSADSGNVPLGARKSVAGVKKGSADSGNVPLGARKSVAGVKKGSADSGNVPLGARKSVKGPPNKPRNSGDKVRHVSIDLSSQFAGEDTNEDIPIKKNKSYRKSVFPQSPRVSFDDEGGGADIPIKTKKSFRTAFPK